jgi:hypothetical protein
MRIPFSCLIYRLQTLLQALFRLWLAGGVGAALIFPNLPPPALLGDFYIIY